MIKFGLKDYQTWFPQWSKHHKTLGIQVKREYKNGEVVLPEDEKVKKLVEENEHLLKSKHVSLRDRKTGERKEAVDYFLPVENLEYEPANIDYYASGASNTKQTTYVRLTFMSEYDRCVLEYKFKGSGSYATTFFGMLDSSDFVEEMLEEIMAQGKPIEEVGIAPGDDEYHVVLVSPEGDPFDAHIEQNEFLNSLVGIEVYKFDHEIVS